MQCIEPMAHLGGGCCERGDLQISNLPAENVIRSFALDRRAWLFADTSQGARASATCYSLVETALCRMRHRAVYAEPRTMPHPSFETLYSPDLPLAYSA